MAYGAGFSHTLRGSAPAARARPAFPLQAAERRRAGAVIVLARIPATDAAAPIRPPADDGGQAATTPLASSGHELM